MREKLAYAALLLLCAIAFFAVVAGAIMILVGLAGEIKKGNTLAIGTVLAGLGGWFIWGLVRR